VRCNRLRCGHAITGWCVLTLHAGQERIGIRSGEATWQEARQFVRDAVGMSSGSPSCSSRWAQQLERRVPVCRARLHRLISRRSGTSLNRP
jgi:hypothetical protein